MSSAISFNLDQSKILWSGTVLRTETIILLTFCWLSLAIQNLDRGCLPLVASFLSEPDSYKGYC